MLVRANGHADPILRALNMAGIPWRFSGTSGLYARPEVRMLLAFLRVVADLDSSVDLYALAASDVYGLGGEDLTAIVNMARRRNRSVWAILDELDRQPGILRVAPGDAGRRRIARRGPARLRGDGPRATGRRAPVPVPARQRAAGPARRRRTRRRRRRQLQNIARFFEIVRAQSALLADDRAIFVAPHLATLIEAGDDPATAELDPDADAVAVLTVHKAKGLEFPVVFLPGHGRRPVPVDRSRRDRWPCPAGLGRGVAADARDGARRGAAPVLRGDDPCARRAGPVATPRTTAAPARGASRRSCSRRSTCRPPPACPGAGARTSTPVERLADVRGDRARRRSRPDGPITEPLSLSFYQIDDYLTCPLKYKYAHVLRVPLAPHHAIIYGVRAAQGRPALPQPARQGPGDERGRARRGVRGGLVERGVREPRPRGGAARGRAGGAAPVPGGAARSPTP